MSDPAVSAFDPIFYLHHWFEHPFVNSVRTLTLHSNIDRQFAMWQILYPKDKYPNTWFQPDDVPNAESDLLPFRAEQNTYWKSDDVIDWTKFQYGYYGLEPKAMGDATIETPDQRRTRVIEDIRTIYHSTATAADFADDSIIKPAKSEPAPPAGGLSAEEAPLGQEEGAAPAPPESSTVSAPAPADAAAVPIAPHLDVIEHPDYIVNILYDR